MIKLGCIVGLALACLLLRGGQPPTWLLKGEVVVIVGGFSLVYGFTAFSPRLPAWLRYQEVRGVVLVALGCGALFVPSQIICSALLVGIGARLVMTSGPKPPSAAGGDIILRPTGEIRPTR